MSCVACAWVGKEFPDMRQNERRIEFIRMGDAVRAVGSRESGHFHGLVTADVDCIREIKRH